MRKVESLLRLAFDSSAPHISNLDTVRMLILETAAQAASIDDAIASLENRLPDTEVTLRTDIRILINAIRHALREGKTPR